MVTGMQIAWIYNNEYMNFPWARGHSWGVIVAYASFYLAAIIGLIFASIVIDRLTKKNIYVSYLVIVACKEILSYHQSFLVHRDDACSVWIGLRDFHAKESFRNDDCKNFNWSRSWLRLSSYDGSRFRDYDAEIEGDGSRLHSVLHYKFDSDVWRIHDGIGTRKAWFWCNAMGRTHWCNLCYLGVHFKWNFHWRIASFINQAEEIRSSRVVDG